MTFDSAGLIKCNCSFSLKVTIGFVLSLIKEYMHGMLWESKGIQRLMTIFSFLEKAEYIPCANKVMEVN